ncbi:MAG: hypothetical protein RBT69_08840 [Spirochaetia bacterium]|jgi:hypothetical protein|nr:hypothetical protein [Spirochaetia bacterium]
MFYLIFVLSIAFLFYLLIPGIGAFLARREWREFREKIIAASTVPVIDFQKSRTAGYGLSGTDGYTGNYKYFGSMEAIQDEYEVWLRSGNFTVSVDMNRVKIYLIPAFSHTEEKDNEMYEKNSEIIMDEMPQVLKWERFYSLPQRTDVMVCGPLFLDKGKAIFKSTSENNITFLIYNSNPDTLLRRGVWAGRHRNEFWNIFTPISLIAGSFALFMTAYFLYSRPVYDFLPKIALSLSLVPFMPLFPPGVILFFTYRHFWKKARFLRAERDLLKLPLRFFSKESFEENSFCREPETGKNYCCRKLDSLEDALNLCSSGNVKIRSSSVVNKNKTPQQSYYYFYQCGKGTTDPLVENIVIEGNPAKLSRECKKKSKRYEYLSIAVFCAGMAVNAAISYLFIASLSR